MLWFWFFKQAKWLWFWIGLHTASLLEKSPVIILLNVAKTLRINNNLDHPYFKTNKSIILRKTESLPPQILSSQYWKGRLVVPFTISMEILFPAENNTSANSTSKTKSLLFTWAMLSYKYCLLLRCSLTLFIKIRTSWNGTAVTSVISS